jgi:hypothetical protein
MITLEELLWGTDEDVVINAYLILLGRWPDEAGLAHHLATIRNQPERRRAMIEAIAGSEEGRLAGRVFPPPGAATAERALAAQLRLRTAFLIGEIARARDAARPALPPEWAEEQARLGAELDMLKHELRARLAALEASRAEALPTAPAVPEGMADYLLDLIAAAEARMLERLRLLERRAFPAGGEDRRPEDAAARPAPGKRQANKTGWSGGA